MASNSPAVEPYHGEEKGSLQRSKSKAEEEVVGEDRKAPWWSGET